MKLNYKIKVLLVDDNQIFLDGLSNLIANEESIEKVGEAYNGEEALKILSKVKVDIVILDINMPVMDGITAAEIIKAKFPSVRVLILTLSADGNIVHKAIQVGVLGYLLKNQAKEEIVQAIYDVYDGIECFSNKIYKILTSNIRNSYQIARLTKRELEILKLIADGYRTKEISDKLHIAISTVEVHRRNLMDKTGASNSQSLVKYALKNKLI